MKESYPKLIPLSKGKPAVSSKASDRLPEVITAIGQIHFEGNIIPHEWFRHIKLPSGNTDVIGILLLAEIVYWYRPVTTIDEETGQQVVIRKKFKGDMFQSSLSYYEGKFGLTKDQVRQALKRLEASGFIRREYRDIIQRGVKFTRITFVEPVPRRIREITHPEPTDTEVQEYAGSDEPERDVGPPQGAVSVPQGAVSVPQGAVSVPQGAVSVPLYGDLPETSTKTYRDFSETTTTTTTPAPVQNVTGGSSGSSKLIFDFNLATLTQAQRQRVATILKGLDTEIAQQVLDELNHAVGCGCIKKSEWAWLQRVAQSAQEGTFTPTSDLADRRQAPVQTAAAPLPTRQPSQTWEEHREELPHHGVTPADYHTYIAPLHGREDSKALWLEAPNRFVADWVLAHLSQIEQAMKAHTRLPIQVCIG